MLVGCDSPIAVLQDEGVDVPIARLLARAVGKRRGPRFPRRRCSLFAVDAHIAPFEVDQLNGRNAAVQEIAVRPRHVVVVGIGRGVFHHRRIARSNCLLLLGVAALNRSLHGRLDRILRNRGLHPGYGAPRLPNDVRSTRHLSAAGERERQYPDQKELESAQSHWFPSRPQVSPENLPLL